MREIAGAKNEKEIDSSLNFEVGTHTNTNKLTNGRLWELQLLLLSIYFWDFIACEYEYHVINTLEYNKMIMRKIVRHGGSSGREERKCGVFC